MTSLASCQKNKHQNRWWPWSINSISILPFSLDTSVLSSFRRQLTKRWKIWHSSWLSCVCFITRWLNTVYQCLLCSMQRSYCSSASWDRNGSANPWTLSYIANVCLWIFICKMCNKIGGDQGHKFFFLPYLEACYLSLVFITPGLHTMLTRVTKGSPFQAFHQFEEFHSYYTTVVNDHNFFYVFYLLFCLNSVSSDNYIACQTVKLLIRSSFGFNFLDGFGLIHFASCKFMLLCSPATELGLVILCFEKKHF